MQQERARKSHTLCVAHNIFCNDCSLGVIKIVPQILTLRMELPNKFYIYRKSLQTLYALLANALKFEPRTNTPWEINQQHALFIKITRACTRYTSRNYETQNVPLGLLAAQSCAFILPIPQHFNFSCEKLIAGSGNLLCSREQFRRRREIDFARPPRLPKCHAKAPYFINPSRMHRSASRNVRSYFRNERQPFSPPSLLRELRKRASLYRQKRHSRAKSRVLPENRGELEFFVVFICACRRWQNDKFPSGYGIFLWLSLLHAMHYSRVIACSFYLLVTFAQF